MSKIILLAALAMIVAILVTACAPKPAPMDWKALADYLDQQEKQK